VKQEIVDFARITDHYGVYVEIEMDIKDKSYTHVMVPKPLSQKEKRAILKEKKYKDMLEKYNFMSPEGFGEKVLQQPEFRVLSQRAIDLTAMRPEWSKEN
jgi:hypothetical protein